MVMGLVSGFSLASHSYSESFLVVHTLFGQDGCQREGFWEVVRYVVSPFDLSWTFPVGGGLLVLCSLPGSPVVKQLMKMVTMVPGWAISVTLLPLTIWFKENVKFDIKGWYMKPANLFSILSTYELVLSESFQWEGQLDVHNHVFMAVFSRPLAPSAKFPSTFTP